MHTQSLKSKQGLQHEKGFEELNREDIYLDPSILLHRQITRSRQVAEVRKKKNKSQVCYGMPADE